MKAERISIFNYEAFYLDHLEGNLGEEDTALLLQFLANHPDLIVDEEDFLSLDLPAETVVFDDKDSLKIVADHEAITLSNVEYFLVAEVENQLSADKKVELNAFITKHPHLERERMYTAAMVLKADESIVFGEKSSLKRKAAVVFWPYIALAAASVLIAFLVMMGQPEEQNTIAKKDPAQPVKHLKKGVTPKTIEKEPIQVAVDDNSDVNPTNDELAPNNSTVNPSVQSKTPGIAVVDNLERKNPRRIIQSLDAKDLGPVSSYMKPQPQIVVQPNDPALAVAEEMKNPIKPITNQLSKTLNQEVDFKTGRAANNRGSGFYLKIGKLEISRKKSGKKD
jgi:hypothetical protein